MYAHLQKDYADRRAAVSRSKFAVKSTPVKEGCSRVVVVEAVHQLEIPNCEQILFAQRRSLNCRH